MDIKERASQAALILDNPIIEEMWETLEKDHIVNWLNTTDYTEQESYWHKINAPVSYTHLTLPTNREV